MLELEPTPARTPAEGRGGLTHERLAWLIQLRWGATIYGEVELSLRPSDRRGLLLGLYVEPRHRRRSVGRVLAPVGSSLPWWVQLEREPTREARRRRILGRIGALPAPARLCSHQETEG